MLCTQFTSCSSWWWMFFGFNSFKVGWERLVAGDWSLVTGRNLYSVKMAGNFIRAHLCEFVVSCYGTIRNLATEDTEGTES
ncbi:hypothetical protein J7M23_06090 [Candidatus Sumerlaeota bacterium]|nr:hypothetical protein [Candidatus Sumerlaeota bacterium]